MSQKIKYIKIRDFKGIKEIEANNLSRFVAIFGKNGAGKTSFIEAIKNAIKAEKGVNSKVRIGEENGEIIVEFDDFKIKRIVGNKGKLEVEHNGELVEKPQARLDHIFLGTIGDPQKFLNLRNKEKVKYLLETQGKKIEFDEIEEKRVKVFEERTNKHRTLLAKREEIEQSETIGEIKEPEGNIEELENKLKEIDKNNEEYYKLKERLQDGDRFIENKENKILESEQSKKESISKIEYMQKQIEIEKDSIKKLENNIVTFKQEKENAEKIKKEIQEAISKINLTEKDSIMQEIREYNQKRNEYSDRKAEINLLEKQKEQLNILSDEWSGLNKQVIELEEEQNKLISSINLDYKFAMIDGQMYVNEGDNMILIDELNKAKQLEIGVDICLNGPNKIKIITIEDANSFDPKSLEAIKKKIEEKEAQCFLETVYNTGYENITIEDGEILSE